MVKIKPSIFCLIAITLLLLMPSIPAIQQKIIGDNANSDLVEQLDFKDIKELVDSGKLDKIKHPLLCALVNLYLGFLFLRGAIIFILSLKFSQYEGIPGFTIKHPILYLRFLWFVLKFRICWAFWITVSTILDWNWEILG